ncbi:hypothetical protein FOZ60_004054 [Perkinsus olseni]|uniref:K Homology domain-containing protein n=1 Tax=Perkinsus olseni TaxID=32597 RepID=A0A7J6PHA7_PEROL|nr:hypothetical protein FOZ60_004054 [Perkinsus olseni]
MALITVQVPAGASPGSTIQVVDPTTGSPLQVQVPQGVYPGQTFQVQTPGNVGGAPGYSQPPSNIPYADGNPYGGYNAGSQPPPSFSREIAAKGHGPRNVANWHGICEDTGPFGNRWVNPGPRRQNDPRASCENTDSVEDLSSAKYDGDRVVTLSGGLESVLAAAEEICRKCFAGEGCHPVTDLSRIPVEFGGRMDTISPPAPHVVQHREPPYGYFLIRLLVPDTSVPRILGPCGAIHREMCRRSQSRISVSPRNASGIDRVVEVTGSTMQVLLGVREVVSATQQDHHLRSSMWLSMIPESRIDTFSDVPVVAVAGMVLEGSTYRRHAIETLVVLGVACVDEAAGLGPITAVHGCLRRLVDEGLLGQHGSPPDSRISRNHPLFQATLSRHPKCAN